LSAPNLQHFQQNGLLQPGAVVNFKGFDPSGIWAHIETILPDGTPIEGYVMRQNISTVAPNFHYTEPGMPMSSQAYASAGGTKG
jgi:hypothetical protein